MINNQRQEPAYPPGAPAVTLPGYVEPLPTITAGQLALVTCARLALNTAYRVLYPLLPFLATSLSVSAQTVSLLVTVLVIGSLVSPLGGALSDTRGERAAMLYGLVVFCLGTALCAVADTFGVFLAGYALIGLSVALYLPGAQSYVSSRTPYDRRGLALGLLETSWAGAALLGVAPLMQLLERTDSVAPVFWVLLGVGLASLALVRYALPPTPPHAQASQRIDWGALRMPRVLGLLGLMGLALMAVDLIFVAQSPWLQATFGASDAQLGQVFAVLGVAELVGSLGSALLCDRFGKKRSVVVGFLATGVFAALLPLSAGDWWLMLALFFMFDLCFEYAIVSAFPLASGVAPAVRGTVLALTTAMIGIGRASGALVSVRLWEDHGMISNGLLAAALIAAGVALCVRFVQETEQAAG